MVLELWHPGEVEAPDLGHAVRPVLIDDGLLMVFSPEHVTGKIGLVLVTGTVGVILAEHAVQAADALLPVNDEVLRIAA